MNIRHSIVSLLLVCSGLVVSTLQAAPAKPQQELAAGSALLIDLKTGQELYSSNPDLRLPVASVTKLMTAMVALDAKLPLDEVLPITIRDTAEMQGVFSRVRIGSEISRRQMLHLALMASENRAAASLAHHYPGGHGAFVAAMNTKAKALGMHNSRFVEPTGMSERNVSTARDLALMIKAAQQYPLIGQFSTDSEVTMAFRKPNYTLGFRNTNALVRKADWDIDLSKTGFTNAAGRCLVMLTSMNRRPVAFVVLGAFGKYTHMADANRLKRWMETGKVTPVPAAALSYKRQKLAEWSQYAGQ
ncbi:MAG: D-alanyl-D-alanine endopeptidase [Pseudomonas sp.]|nr:D-alanyl-D-alanine endopeptidase [Pseudomonas sp.]